MRIFLITLAYLLATPLCAAPVSYSVNQDKSQVGFSYTFGNTEVEGEFPDYKIDVAIDFKNIQNSTVSVILDTQTAKGGFVFGTSAMRSKKILFAKKFPEITFVSSAVSGGGHTAIIEGDINVRGVVKPLRLNAELFRAQGTLPSEQENLVLKISGEINRFDFGATGYAKEVGQNLTINIKADISRNE